jgi:hypothetical protein
MTRIALVSFALAAAASAATDSSGVAKVLPMSAAFTKKGVLRAKASITFREAVTGKNRFREFMEKHPVKVFIAVRKRIESSKWEFIAGHRRHRHGRRHRHCDYRRHRHCDYRRHHH